MEQWLLTLNKFSLNVVELMNMILAAYVLVVLSGKKSVDFSYRALYRVITSRTFYWFYPRRGACGPCPEAFMRLLGMSEVARCLKVDDNYVPGVLNVIADPTCMPYSL